LKNHPRGPEGFVDDLTKPATSRGPGPLVECPA
jgi:hypothetical protein